MEEKKNTEETPVKESTSHEAERDPKKEKKDEKSAKNELKKLRAEIAELKKNADETAKKLAECEDKYLHLAAEYDNFRKRSAKERDGIYADATADALSSLLPLIDNLQRASAYTESDKLAEGVKMILSGLPAVLDKMNVKQFGEKGETFDPNLHNAVMHIDDDAYGEGEIVDVLQSGYKVGDKIIRYAMVKTAN